MWKSIYSNKSGQKGSIVLPLLVGAVLFSLVAMVWMGDKRQSTGSEAAGRRAWWMLPGFSQFTRTNPADAPQLTATPTPNTYPEYRECSTYTNLGCTIGAGAACAGNAACGTIRCKVENTDGSFTAIAQTACTPLDSTFTNVCRGDTCDPRANPAIRCPADTTCTFGTPTGCGVGTNVWHCAGNTQPKSCNDTMYDVCDPRDNIPSCPQDQTCQFVRDASCGPDTNFQRYGCVTNTVGNCDCRDNSTCQLQHGDNYYCNRDGLDPNSCGTCEVAPTPTQQAGSGQGSPGSNYGYCPSNECFRDQDCSGYFFGGPVYCKGEYNSTCGYTIHTCDRKW